MKEGEDPGKPNPQENDEPEKKEQNKLRDKIDAEEDPESKKFDGLFGLGGEKDIFKPIKKKAWNKLQQIFWAIQNIFYLRMSIILSSNQ